jgi:hypothetical protein
MVEQINRAKHLIATLIAVTGLIVLREVTGLSSWLLFIPVLLATFALISLWDRLASPSDD